MNAPELHRIHESLRSVVDALDIALHGYDEIANEERAKLFGRLISYQNAIDLHIHLKRYVGR